MTNKNKILVIKLGALGDFIQALGPMKSIRENHTKSYITLLTTKNFEKFAKKSNYFDEIWIDERPKLYQIKRWLNFKTKLNNAKFNRIYDLQNNDRSSIYFKLFKKPKPEWVGIAKGASHRNTSKERTKGQSFDGHVMTLNLAGIQNVKIDNLSWVTADISNFKLKDKYVLIVAGSSPQHPYKRWSCENYISLCNELISKNIQPVLLGTSAESQIIKEISNNCKGTIDLVGKTSLDQIVILARNALCAIGNDTGPMHIIAPTGCPSVILFSKHSNPTRHAPKGNKVKTLQVDNLQEMTLSMVNAAIEEYI